MGGIGLAPKFDNSELVVNIEKTMDKLRKQLKIHNPYRRVKEKVGRNAPCPCGSGLKFKKCCLGV